MHNTKISIITPSYNSGTTIEKAIRSVMCQDYTNFEHIIIDGESTDNTLAILEQYPHLKWISEKDNGQSDAMQKGFKLSSGEIIAYLNADDYFLPGTFSIVINQIMAGADFVVGKVKVNTHENENIREWINDPRVKLDEMLYHWQIDAFPVNPVGYFYKREIQEQFPFNLENHDKMDLEFLLLAATQYSFSKVNKLFGVYNQETDTKTMQEQLLPSSYWNKENFTFINTIVKTMPEAFRTRVYFDQLRGYQLRRNWTALQSIRMGMKSQLLQQKEIFLLPKSLNHNTTDYLEDSCIVTREDWVVILVSPTSNTTHQVQKSLLTIPFPYLPTPIYQLSGKIRDENVIYELKKIKSCIRLKIMIELENMEKMNPKARRKYFRKVKKWLKQEWPSISDQSIDLEDSLIWSKYKILATKTKDILIFSNNHLENFYTEMIEEFTGLANEKLL